MQSDHDRYTGHHKQWCGRQRTVGAVRRKTDILGRWSRRRSCGGTDGATWRGGRRHVAGWPGVPRRGGRHPWGRTTARRPWPLMAFQPKMRPYGLRSPSLTLQLCYPVFRSKNQQKRPLIWEDVSFSISIFCTGTEPYRLLFASERICAVVMQLVGCSSPTASKRSWVSSLL